MPEIKFSSRAQNAFSDLETLSGLQSIVSRSIDHLERRRYEFLNIKLIQRKKKPVKIYEIIIKYPLEYRIFYREIRERNEIWILDMRMKKKNAFQSKYFEILEKIRLSLLF
ncbi:MAG: hypothetical protein LBQ96_06710 [Fusobacteriaceae bacterium]|jgi:hypothetical protein|nr:hypothetical protein [Fusobacteriaceae bacterium]